MNFTKEQRDALRDLIPHLGLEIASKDLRRALDDVDEIVEGANTLGDFREWLDRNLADGERFHGVFAAAKDALELFDARNAQKAEERGSEEKA